MKTIEQNEQYTLFLEKIGPEWWLELIDRASGNVKILTARKKALFDGMTINHAIRFMAGQEFKPMYKKWVM